MGTLLTKMRVTVAVVLDGSFWRSETRMRWWIFCWLILLTSMRAEGIRADEAGAPQLLGQDRGAYLIPGSQTFDVTSSSGRNYRIFVWVPDEAAPAGGFPVLLTLDGNAYFATAVTALRVMSPENPMLRMKGSSVRSMIVVGVGYAGEQPFEGGERAFDYLPPLTSVDTRYPREGWPGRPPGGADQFIKFLVDELRPALAARYPIDAGHQSLMGHSLGGFFTLYALMRRPDAFRNYIAISPSLWWDDHELVKRAQASPLSTGTSTNHILVAVARDEIPGNAERSRIMRTLGREMVKHLNRMRSARLEAGYVELTAEDHQSMQIAAMPGALRVASQ
jgi:predicted alpha/beta superfamily hydrolase